MKKIGSIEKEHNEDNSSFKTIVAATTATSGGREYSKLSEEDSDDVKEKKAKTPNPLSMALSSRIDREFNSVPKESHLYSAKFTDLSSFGDLMRRDQLTFGDLKPNADRVSRKTRQALYQNPSTFNEGEFFKRLKTGEKKEVFAFLKGTKELDFSSKDRDRNTFLHLACARGFHKVATLLIERGAPVNATNILGKTPLHLACVTNVETADLLISHKQINVKIKDVKGRTALHKACSSQDERFVKIIKKLLKHHNMKIDVTDNTGRTPLSLAYESACPSIVNLLLKKGASPDIADNEGKLPVEWEKEKKKSTLFGTTRLESSNPFEQKKRKEKD
jgi:ankyrin repeat protein